MLKRLGGETILIVHAALVPSSRDNSLNRDWANATTTPAYGCSVQPFRMSNKLIKVDDQDREWVQEFLRVYIPVGQPVPEYVDRIEWRGSTYEAFGPSQPLYDRRGNLHHTQLIIRFRAG